MRPFFTGFYAALALIIVTSHSFGQNVPELVVSSGHHHSITTLDFSPDGRYIASGGDDKLVKIYDLRMQQELLTIAAFSWNLTQVGFSPDGKYLISLADKELFVHAHPSGEMVYRIFIEEVLRDCMFYCTRSGKILLGNSDEGIRVYDLVTGQLERTLEECKVNLFAVSPDEQSLVCAAPDENGNPGLQFVDLQSGTGVAFLPQEQGMMEGFAVDKANGVLAWEFFPGKMVLVDLKTRKTIREMKTETPGLLTASTFSPDGKKLYTAGFDNVVKIWDLGTGKILQTVKDLSPSGDAYSMSMGIRAIKFSPDGSIIACGYQDVKGGKSNFTVEWFQAKNLESIGRHYGDVKISPNIAVDHSGSTLCTGSLGETMGTKFIDIVSGTHKQFVSGSPYFASGGKRICAARFTDKGYELVIYESPSLRIERTIELFGYSELFMSTSGRYVAAIDQLTVVNPKPGGDLVKPHIRVWDCETGEEQLSLQRNILDGLEKICFSADEKEVYVLYQTKVEVLSLDGKLLREFAIEFEAMSSANLSPDGTKLVLNNYTQIYTVDLHTGEIKVLLEEELRIYMATTISPDKRFLAVALIVAGQAKPNRVQLYDWNTMEMLCEFTGHSGTLRNLCIDQSGTHLFSVDDNGVVGMWDIPNCLLKSSFLAFGTEDYLIINPEGYYKSSKGNIANIGFRLNGKLYSFDQFDLRYNRPDLILKSIGLASETQISLYEKAYQKRLRRMGFEEADFTSTLSAPEIEIPGLEALPIQVTEAELNLNWRARDENANLDRLQVLVNDVPIYGKLGIDLKAKASKTLEETVKIPLTAGTNKIQLAVMNEQGIESARISYSVECKKPVQKPDLYVLAYGVRAFQDSTMNLTYSDKDAEDFTKMLQTSAGTGVFKNVYVHLVRNEEVNRESLVASRAFLEQSKVDDQVVLFFSGHGLLSQDMDYFLSTHDVDFARPEERGISFEAFQNLMDNIAARDRILLVDACHSGEVDKDEVAHAPANDVAEVQEKSFAAKGKKVIGLGSSFELMKDLFVELRKEVGATVIASSSGKEFSLESAEWKNGVFTYALKEALTQKRADANADGLIQVSELKKYLAHRVKELTNGRQVPTARSENLQKDIVVY